MENEFTSQKFVSTLKSLRNSCKKSEFNALKIIEQLRFVAESLVWSEQHNENFFIHFVSENTLGILLFLLENHSEKPLVIQLLQTANLLVHNLSRPEHKVYLLSSEFYSNIVSHPFDLSDDEIVENYISFLKSLATNVSSDKLTAFIMDNNFSLYASARMFVSNKDALVKAASRTVILTILKFHNEEINQYIIDSGFIFHIVTILKVQISQLDQSIKHLQHDKLDSLINDCIDSIFYINDMLEQIDPVFTDKLSNTFILILSPVLIGSLNSEVHGPYHVSIHVAFYVLIQVFRIIKFPWLLDIFVKFLLSEKISVVLFDIYNSPPPNSPSKIIEFQSEQQENNSGKQSFLSFLKCKDDNLVCLALLLLQYIVTNKGVTQVLLENLQLSPEHNVDSEIFQGLIQIYGTYPLFRFTNYLIVSKILFELKCIDSELLIRQSCCENIMKLKILLESKEFADAFLDYFDEEWEKVKKINFRGNISVFNHNILPMPSNKVALEQRQPENDYELVRSLIKLFFLMRKLIFFLNSDDPDTYPFIYTSQVKDWKCGNSYSTYGMQFTRVWMKSTEETVRYIVEDEDFFVLVEPDLNKIEFATVVAMEKWRNLEARRDEQFQMANLATRAKAKIDYFFSFENPDYFYIETERIQFKIASSRALEITLAESFLLDTHQKFMEKS